MAKMSKAARLEAREKRRQERGEQITTRFRFMVGFGAAYLGTQVLVPMFAPTLAENQALVDGALAIGGGYLALTNPDEIGDYATGAGAVGAIQTLDNIGTKITEWRARNA